MANYCSFSMIVKGKIKNIEQFINMMEQKGTVWMGRGASVDFSDMEDLDMEEIGNEKFRCQIDGSTKWSIKSSLIDNAISMRTEPDVWSFGKEIDKTKLSFITLFEACQQLELDMEAYSEECGCCFQEHYLFVEGELIKEECVDYVETYNEDTEEYETEGGFDWNFEI